MEEIAKEELKGDVTGVTEQQTDEKHTVTVDMTKLDKKSMEILEETEEDDYKFKLDQFEGPLDLLLHLVRITKIDIFDIFVSDITEQYLEYIKDTSYLDVDKASEFISLAATLLELKSNHLLPKDEELSEEEDPEIRFLRSVREHELFKAQSEKLALIEDVNRLYKAPDDTVGEFKYELPDQLSVSALITAFSDLMQKVTIKAEAIQEKKIVKDRFTVAQKIGQIKDILLSKNKFRFEELFEAETTRSEIINTFLALLELLKRQYITVQQDNLFGEIDILKNPDENARLDDIITNEFDQEED